MTADKYEEGGHLNGSTTILDQSKLRGTCKLWQKVIATGPLCRYVKEGDWVMIDPIRYIKVEHPEDIDSVRSIVTVRNDYSKYSLPAIKIDGTQYILINEQDIAFVINEFEEK